MWCGGRGSRRQTLLHTHFLPASCPAGKEAKACYEVRGVLQYNLPGSLVDGAWKVERHASTARPTYLTPYT